MCVRAFIVGGPTEYDGRIALDLRAANVHGSISLCQGFVAKGCILLTDAEISGQLNIYGARLWNARRLVLECYSAQVSGSVFLRNGLACEGGMSFIGARLGGDVILRGRLNNSGGTALDFSTARIGSNLYLDHGFVSDGSVKLSSATIGGNFLCNGGKFRVVAGDAITCDALALAGTFFAGEGFVARGRVSFAGASIGGYFAARGAAVSKGHNQNESNDAIDLSNCRVTGDVTLSNAVIVGRLVAVSANIGGQLNLRDARLTNPGGAAFQGDASIVRSGVFLEGARAEGLISFLSAEIGCFLFCTNAVLAKGQQNIVLSLQSAEVRGNANLNGLRCNGAVLLTGTKIAGRLDCGGSQLVSEGPGRAIGVLICDQASIGASAYLNNGFRAVGEVRLVGVTIAQDLVCTDGEFSAASPEPALPNPHALVLERSKVGGIFRLCDRQRKAKIEGPVSLQDSSVAILIDRHDERAGETVWPVNLRKNSSGSEQPWYVNLDGFRYDRFAENAPTDAVSRKSWLTLQPPDDLGVHFRPQPFEQLAKVFKEMGHDGEANEISRFKHRMRRKSQARRLAWELYGRPRKLGQRVLLPLGLVPWLLGHAWLAIQRLVMGAILGDGFAKWRPILLLLMMGFGFGAYFDYARDDMFPTNPTVYTNTVLQEACTRGGKLDWARCHPPESFKAFNRFLPYVYSFDNMLPVAQLGQKRDWQPEPGGIYRLSLTQALAYAQIVLSLALYLLITAIVTGVIKK